MKKVAVLVCLVGALSAATPAIAKTDSDIDTGTGDDAGVREQMERAGESLKESLKTLMNLIQNVVKDVPQYEAPEILDNGDIIIRRKNPDEEKNGGSEDGHVRT